MTRVLYKDIALLDARKVTEETAQRIYGIEDVGLLLLTPTSQRALGAVPCTDIGNVYVVEEGADVCQVNGQCMFCGREGKPVILMVNGQLEVSPETTAEEIRQSVFGGQVNGEIIASESQTQALLACGVTINGQTSAYPDGFLLRRGKNPLTRTEVEAWPEGARRFMQKRVRLEPGALAAIKARGARIGGRLIVEEGEAALLVDVYEGETGQCGFVHDGARVTEERLRINRHNAMTLRGRVCALEDVIIDAGVTQAQLEKLEMLTVKGKLIVPTELVETLIERVSEDAEWLPYEGKLLANEGMMHMDAATLADVSGATLYNEGMITLDETLGTEDIQKGLSLIYNEGSIRGTAEQIAALRRIQGGGDGEMRENRQESKKTVRTLPEDVVITGDMAELTLG